MRRIGGYVAGCILLVGVTATPLSVWLDPAVTRGLWVAGVAACVVQAATFAARVRWGGKPERLLVVWAAGTGARFTAVGLAAWAVFRWETLHPVSTLVGLAGYLFSMLLFEPVFYGLGGTDDRHGDMASDART